MRGRVEQIEAALAEVQAENQRLRAELEELKAVVAQLTDIPGPAAVTQAPRGWRTRWSIALLVLFIVVVPVIALTFGHVDAFWSTVIGTLNALFLYFIGPGAVRLLAEGIARAIPAVLLGQSFRIWWEQRHTRRAKKKSMDA